jgi:hypothetical protein
MQSIVLEWQRRRQRDRHRKMDSFECQGCGTLGHWFLRFTSPNISLPLGLLSTQSMMTIKQIAPPADIVEEPKWPERTYSRASSTKISLSTDESSLQILSQSPSTDIYESASITQKPMLKQRSASENHLSTILWSTSQRLKYLQRQSFTWTLTSLRRVPAPPPQKRLPTPTKGLTESHEALIEPDRSDFAHSSASSSYITRTPSLQKQIPRSAGQAPPKRGESPMPSTGSDDSLCGIQTPDLAIPGLLTSPSRSGRRVNNNTEWGSHQVVRRVSEL